MQGPIENIQDRDVFGRPPRASEDGFRELVELLPDAILVHRGGDIAYANRAAVRLLGDRGPGGLLGRPILDLAHPDHRDDLGGAIRATARSGAPGRPVAARLRRADGSEVDVEVTCATIDDADRAAGLVVVRDMTGHRYPGGSLADAGILYRTLIEQVPAVTYIWDFREGLERAKVPYVSPQMEEVLGFPPEDFMADANFWWERTHPEDRDAVIAETARSVDAGDPFHMEYRMIARDGRVVWVRDDASAVVQEESGRVLVHQGILADVSERRRMAAELEERWEQLKRADAERRRLLSRLVVAQEEERRRIATAIHDDPVQKLTALAIRLDVLGADHPGLAQEARFGRLMESVRGTIANLRNLMFELHPYSLDRDGELEVALRSLVEREASEDPDARFELRWTARSGISPDAATLLYRIAQEALVNVRKHARASHVAIEVTDRDRGVGLIVRDDGLGFALDPTPHSPPGHLGLTAMRERAEMAGGTFRVDSPPGAGTTIEVWIPTY